MKYANAALVMMESDGTAYNMPLTERVCIDRVAAHFMTELAEALAQQLSATHMTHRLDTIIAVLEKRTPALWRVMTAAEKEATVERFFEELASPHMAEPTATLLLLFQKPHLPEDIRTLAANMYSGDFDAETIVKRFVATVDRYVV